MSTESDSGDQRREQVENLARVLAEVIDTSRPKNVAKTSWALAAFQALTKNWAVFLFVVSVVGAIVGWLVFEISPFHALEEIAMKQKEQRRTELQVEYKHRLVQRHIELANSFLSIAQLEAAKIEFENALKLDPNNVEAHLGKLKAEIFLPIANKEYIPEIAERKLTLVLKERPDDAHVLSFLGDIYRSISKEVALAYYQKAIVRDPTVASAYHGIALIHDQDKNNDDAIKMYEKALSLSIWHQSYLNNLGYQYLQRKDYRSAIEKYDLLLKLDHRYLLTYYTLSNAYRLTGNFQLASSYQDLLIELLDDDKITALQRNGGEWFFHTDFRLIHFYDYPMKKCYAYYNAALTAHMLRNAGKAESYIVKARRTNSPNERLVKELMRHDIKNLKQAQKDYSELLEAFSEKYL